MLRSTTKIPIFFIAILNIISLLVVLEVQAQFENFDLIDDKLWEQYTEAKQDREYLECVHDLDPHCYYRQDNPDSFADINENVVVGGGRRKRADEIINCFADGTCTSQPFGGGQNGGQNRDTCCGICKSCTFENCCHCSFADKDKYCPIPGWRAADYTGKNGMPIAKGNSTLQPRQPSGGNHRCFDVVILAAWIYHYLQVLQQRAILIPGTNLVTTPYIRRDWAYVVGYRTTGSSGTAGLDVRPNEGLVLERRMDHNGLTRTEILERYIQPQDIRTRGGDFTAGQRAGFFATHDGVNATDQMGHILGNTLGGPNTLVNCFPQHEASNNNVGGADPNAPNWVATEYAIRQFLSAGSLARYVQFRVHLIYPSTTTGRPSEIVWTAIFMDGTQTVNTMGGRILNDGSPHSNICNAPGGK